MKNQINHHQWPRSQLLLPHSLRQSRRPLPPSQTSPSSRAPQSPIPRVSFDLPLLQQLKTPLVDPRKLPSRDHNATCHPSPFASKTSSSRHRALATRGLSLSAPQGKAYLDHSSSKPLVPMHCTRRMRSAVSLDLPGMPKTFISVRYRSLSSAARSS